MRRFALAICLALGLLAVPLTAAAKSPTIYRYTSTPPDLSLSGVCAFDITIHSTIQTTEIDYVDANGALTRVYINGTEQDTFSGPGGSLTTVPYTYNLQVRFDSTGAVTGLVATGVILKVRLPDGSWFLSAGRLNVLAHPEVGYSFVPDVGHSGNVGALCAALAQR
jgi:hypothetical protein